MKRILVLLAATAILIAFGIRAAERGARDVAPALGATGIGVKDLEVSTRFYEDVLGMKVLRRFELGYLNEVVLGFPEAAARNVVLMNWPHERNTRVRRQRRQTRLLRARSGAGHRANPRVTAARSIAKRNRSRRSTAPSSAWGAIRTTTSSSCWRDKARSDSRDNAEHCAHQDIR